jgi:Ca-activated chloride channel family protein
MLLRNSEFKADADFRSVKNIAQSAIGDDAEGYRQEFIRLVKKASSLKEKETAQVDTNNEDDQ